MRVLIKTDRMKSLLIEPELVEFENFCGREKVRIETCKGTVYIRLLEDTLEKVQTEFLKNGFYDFREFCTDLEYFRD